MPSIITARKFLTTFALVGVLYKVPSSLFDTPGRMLQYGFAGVPTSLLAGIPLFMLCLTKGVHEISVGAEMTHLLQLNNSPRLQMPSRKGTSVQNKPEAGSMNNDAVWVVLFCTANSGQASPGAAI